MTLPSTNPERLIIGEDLEEVLELEAGPGKVLAATRPCPGRSAEENEDAAAILPLDAESLVLAVADGAGGMRSGQTASRLAIEELARALRERDEQDSIRDVVLSAIETANRAILETSSGAATTLAVAIIEGDRVRTVHVGDSGILVTGQRGRIRFQAIAHSPVGYAVESGLLDEDEALHHEDRHLVSNLLGTHEMSMELGPEIRLKLRDTLVLGSDGLFDNLTVGEVVELARKGPAKKAVRGLRDEASHRMASPRSDQPSKPDDLTLVAFRLSPRR